MTTSTIDRLGHASPEHDAGRVRRRGRQRWRRLTGGAADRRRRRWLFRKRTKEGEDATDDAVVACLVPASTAMMAGEDTPTGRVVLRIMSKQRGRVAGDTTRNYLICDVIILSGIK
jgi:hypothetical protein